MRPRRLRPPRRRPRAPPAASAIGRPTRSIDRGPRCGLVCASAVGRPIWAGSERRDTGLAPGKVGSSADSLVWREGWRDWQEAIGVFPQLRGDDLAVLNNVVMTVPRSSW